jgi:hypothetical protein
LLILLGHCLQGFFLGFIAALVIEERGLHFSVVGLVSVRITVTSIFIHNTLSTGGDGRSSD